jgi:DNA-binding NarL/FixJ family response regulator
MSDLRILLADDHALFRAGVHSLISAMVGFTVVAEAGDGLEVLRILNAEDVDIVLLDLMMPGLNGLEAATRIAREFPSVAIVILSMHASEEFIAPTLRAGALGYLVKDMQPEELGSALRAVATGNAYVSQAIRARPIETADVISGKFADLTSPRPSQRALVWPTRRWKRTGLSSWPCLAFATSLG